MEFKNMDNMYEYCKGTKFKNMDIYEYCKGNKYHKNSSVGLLVL